MQEITRIVELYRLLRDEGTPCALATVVAIAGSSYRRVGARMLVAADGRFTGGISGGCLEGDALRRAKTAILTDRPSLQVYDTLDDDDRAIGVGLGCNGRIEVLFLPLDLTADDTPVDRLAAIDPLAWDTVRYHLIGGADWLDRVGTLTTLSSPAALAQALGADAAALTAAGERAVVTRSSQQLPVGDYTVLVEYVFPRIHVYVVGDHYDVAALLRVIGEMGWGYSLVGTPGRYTPAAVRAARSVIAPAAFATGELRLGAPYPVVVLMTHDYARDFTLLPRLLARAPAYLGILGPRKRMDRLRTELRAAGDWPATDPDFLYAPIGLDLGAHTPEEIALAVVAEILAVFRGRPGGSLRGGRGSLH